MAKGKTTKKNTQGKNKTVNNKKKTNIKNQSNKNKKIDIKKNSEANSVEQKNEFIRLIKIVLIVTLIFAVFYGVTLLVTKKSSEVINKQEKETKTTEKAEIQYENIIIGTMLNKEGTYYVFIEEDNDVRDAEYQSLIEDAKSNPDTPNIYKANLTDSFNKGYLAKEENYYVSDIADFKVKGTALVKVVDGRIDAVFDNYDAIKNKLNELA